MNKIARIFRYELAHTLKRTGFIILTLSLPVLALVAIGVYQGAVKNARPAVKTTTVGYVDESGGFDRFATQRQTRFVRFESTRQAKQALIGQRVEQYFVIPADFLSTGRVHMYVLHRELAPSPSLSSAVKDFIASNLLAGHVQSDAIARVTRPLDFVMTTLTSTGEVAREQGGYGNFIVPAVFSLLLALSLVFSSVYMLQGLAEEKENRLIEVLLSSVSARQLLTGKLLGYGVAGLLQVAVWVVSMPLLLLFASSSIGGLLATIRVPAGFWLLGVVYFVLGYSLFAVISASVAAVSGTVREAQALAPIFSLFSIAPFWFLSVLMLFPNNVVWVVFSIFPLSAPVLTLLRMGLTGVPAWQLVSSIAVLLACVVGGVFLSGKLLEIYLLMYGKRPTLKVIARNLGRR